MSDLRSSGLKLSDIFPFFTGGIQVYTPEDFEPRKSVWETSPGNHGHICEQCGTKWEHADDTPDRCSSEEFQREHTCQNCGEKQFYKAEPEEFASHHREITSDYTERQW